MADTLYTREHEWLRIGQDGLASIGITEHAQQALGDIVFVEPPEAGRSVAKGEACAVVESVKAASDIYAPLSGTVSESNAALAEDPGLINRDPEGEGWLFRMRLADPAAVAGLLDKPAYDAFAATA